jgi:hypothetical protein
VSSVLDQFRDAEQRIAQRLQELQPAVNEYRELADVAKRLGIHVDAAAATKTTTRPARPESRGAPRQRSRARAAGTGRDAATAKAAAPSTRRVPAGKRSEQLVELVRGRPGITVREAGAELGVDPTSLYRVVHRLEKSGTLRKSGRALEVVTSA